MGPRDIYDEGYKAADDCYSGKGPIKACPYPKESAESSEWYEGYLDAGIDWENRSA